jgi:leucyl aminopeptidase
VAQNAVLQLVISGGVAPFQVQVYRAGEQVWHADDRQAVFAAEEKHVFPDTLASSASELAPFFKDISTSRMKERLTTFSGFRTRYYRSADGKRSQQWLLDQVREVAKRSKAAKITVEEFKHDWGQNSIIAKVHRPDHLKGEGQVVIISAHQDSTNLLPFLCVLLLYDHISQADVAGRAAPGADDDGSGTTTILETLTSLVANDFAPSNHTLEFHCASPVS